MTWRAVVVVGVLAGAVAVGHAPAGGEVAVEVTTEAEYRAALDGASPVEPNRIVLGADIVLDDGTDPRYTSPQPLTIIGAGHVLDARGRSRVLDISAGDAADLRLEDLVVRGGFAADGAGGAVVSAGSVRVLDSAFEGNVGTAAGGAIWAAGPIVVDGSTFTGNGSVRGEGLAVRSVASVAVTNSTFSGNEARSAAAVGTVASDGPVQLLYVTFADNVSQLGSSVATDDDLTTFGTVYGPGSGPHCLVDGTVQSLGHNVELGTSCALTEPSDRMDPDLDLRIGPLADNGGPTETRLPGPGSPLIDAIGLSDCFPDVVTDQRGRSRPLDGGSATLACDIGAVEVAPPAPSSTTDPSTTVPSSGGAPPTPSTPPLAAPPRVATVAPRLVG